MKEELIKRVDSATFHLVKFFQLRSISLPDNFEREIQNTEVKKQDILKASAEQARDIVKFETTVEVAKKAVNETIEKAYAAGNKTEQNAKAVQSTIIDVVRKQTESLKNMKSELSFSEDNILQYLQTTLIKDYQTDSRIGIHLDGL